MRSQRLRRRRSGALVLLALLCAAIALLAYETHLFNRQELSTVDTRFAIRGTEAAPSDLAVVQVDATTFDELGLPWPFPRHLHAELVDCLRRDGARAIAYDVQFTEETVPREDTALIGAVDRAHGRVVLSATEVDAHGDTNIFGGEEVQRHEEVLQRIGARAGSTVIQPDQDGVLRKIPFAFDGLVGFAVATVEVATARKVSAAPLAGAHSFWIDYRGPPGTIPAYSFSRVLHRQVPARDFRDKIVVVGAGDASLQDEHTTPTSGEELMSGPEVEANAIWTVQHGFPLRSTPVAVDILLILLMAAGPPLANWRLKPLAALGTALGLGALFAAVAQLAFDAGRIMPVFIPLATLALSAIGALAVTAIFTAFERQRVHDTFSRFVPEAVVNDVLARADEDHRLGGVRRESTVLFTDLRGFTTYSESRHPDQVLECLNNYMTEMSGAIMDHGGTLVSYTGDGIIALFGAPIEQPDHAYRALAAAREMLFERLPRFNEWMREQRLGEGFQMGIGINTGEIMSGQVGSEQRMEYTVIGDAVNTAARLEGMTKGTPHSVFIAESTKDLLHSGVDGLSYVDELPVRGREATIRIWTISAEQVRANGDVA
jgi:adenylate cyclase